MSGVVGCHGNGRRGEVKSRKKQHLRQVKTEGHLAQHSKKFGMLFFSEKNSQKIACHFRKNSQKKILPRFAVFFWKILGKLAEICMFFLQKFVSKNSRKSTDFSQKFGTFLSQI